MSAHFGALPSDWSYWDLVLGVGADLLPVVCQPNLPISPSSKLVTYGKVPSRFDRSQRVVGFPNWTQHQATDEELAQWAGDSRLGICLQTRQLRALDVDVTDPGKAGPICQYLDSLFPNLGVRYRRDSSKFLCLFWIEGDYAKQTLRCDGGVIEFLANGQQCLVAGRHPDGASYRWRARGGFPTLDGLDLEILQEDLRARFALDSETWSEGRLPKDRDRVNVLGDIVDPVIDYLKALDPLVTPLVRLQADRADVECPWKDQHTAGVDPSSTSFFPAGTGGFETGHFRCLHAHCEGRTTEEFLGAIGYTLDGFTNISNPLEDQAVRSLIGEDGVGTHETIPSPVEGPRFERAIKSGQIKPRINNLLTWLQWISQRGEGVAYDRFKDEITIMTRHGRRSFADQDYTRLQAQAERESFDPLSHQMVRQAVHTIAQDRCFDSAQEWLLGLPPWDGIPRIDRFCAHYLGSSDDDHSRFVGRYLWTAMPGRILQPGIQADMTLIMVSQQGTRKSSTITAIAPRPEWCAAVSFSHNDADLARLTKGKTLIEIPELKGLRSREIEWIKAFVTQRENSWVPKYMEMQTTYARRFMMIGTTNEDEFLADPTGERRWLPLKVGRQNDGAIYRDHDQLWAEGRELFHSGGILWQDAQRSAQDTHLEHTIHDVLIDQVADWLEREDPLTNDVPGGRPYLRLIDVWQDVCGSYGKTPPRNEQMRIADALTRLGYTRRTVYADKRVQKVWMLKDKQYCHVDGKMVECNPSNSGSLTTLPLLPIESKTLKDIDDLL